MSLVAPPSMFVTPSSLQGQQTLSPSSTPATQAHMFWTPGPDERVRERNHKRSPSASTGASHSASTANSRSSSVSSRNEGLGIRFSPNQVGQQLSLFDGPMNGTIRAPTGGSGTNSALEMFASIMEGREHEDEEDSDEENDSDDDKEEAESGGLFGGGSSLGLGLQPAPSISVSSSSRSEASAMSGTSTKSGMNRNIWVPAAPAVTTPKPSRRGEKERKGERGRDGREKKDNSRELPPGTSSSQSHSSARGGLTSSSHLSLPSSSMSASLSSSSSSAASALTTTALSSSLSASSGALVPASASTSASGQDRFYAVAERAREDRLRVRRGEFRSRAEVVAAFRRRVDLLMDEFAEALANVDDVERFGGGGTSGY